MPHPPYNAGTPRPQLLSCFLIGIDDSINGIYKCLGDCAAISKWLVVLDYMFLIFVVIIVILMEQMEKQVVLYLCYECLIVQHGMLTKEVKG